MQRCGSFIPAFLPLFFLFIFFLNFFPYVYYDDASDLGHWREELVAVKIGRCLNSEENGNAYSL